MLTVVAIQLHQLSIVNLGSKRVLDLATVEHKAICSQLHAITLASGGVIGSLRPVDVFPAVVRLQSSRRREDDEQQGTLADSAIRTPEALVVGFVNSIMTDGKPQTCRVVGVRVK